MTTATITKAQRLAEQEDLIERGLVQVGDALQAIHDDELWRETHQSWDEYCADRWNWTPKRVTQLIKASAVFKLLASESTVTIQPENEAQVRPLTGLSDDDAVQTWDDTVNAYGDVPTGEQVKATRDRNKTLSRTTLPADPTPDPEAATRRQVYASGYAPVIQWMQTGKLTPKRALAVADSLDACQPKTKIDVLMLSITDPAVIREMNRIRSSETYQEIVVSGYLQFGDEIIPADYMTRQDLRRYLDMKYIEHRQRAAAERDARNNVKAVSVILWENHVDRTVDELERVFAPAFMLEIAAGITSRYGQ